MANITLDDSDPSILYLPLWNVVSISEPCSKCTATPDLNMMFNQTYHDASFDTTLPDGIGQSEVPVTASVLFNGTALYVFCALSESSPLGYSDMSFYIDGEVKGYFIKTPPGDDSTYNYNVPVFVIESLTSEEHNFTLQSGQVNGSHSLALLDKIVYTAFDSALISVSPSSLLPSPSSTITSMTATKIHWNIIAAVALAVAVLLLATLVFLLWFFFRWKK